MPLHATLPFVCRLDTEQEYQAKLERAAARRAAAERKRHRAIAVCGMVGGKVRVKLKAASMEFYDEVEEAARQELAEMEVASRRRAYAAHFGARSLGWLADRPRAC